MGDLIEHGNAFNALDIELALAKVKATGKPLSPRACAKLLGVPVAVFVRDIGGGRQARQVAGANRYPKRVQQAVNGALQTLARVEALTYFTNEQLAEYFASLKLKADRLLFLGAVLEGIGDGMKKQEAQPQERQCAECGGSLAHLDGEARARHCSPKCRQAAYRKRHRAVTLRASHRPRQASQRRIRNGTDVAEDGLAVTPDRVWGGSAMACEEVDMGEAKRRRARGQVRDAAVSDAERLQKRWLDGRGERPTAKCFEAALSPTCPADVPEARSSFVGSKV